MASIYDLIAQNKGLTATPWGLMSPDITNKQYTEEEANKTFDIIRNLPEYQAQQAGTDELSNELDRLKKLPQVSGDTWVKPLLALADSETGSKLSQGYDENDISQKRNEMIMKYQDAIANRKKQSADTLMSSLGKFKSGTTTTKDTGISPKEQAELDYKKAKAQQDYDIEMQKLAAARGKGSGKAKDIMTEAYLKKYGTELGKGGNSTGKLQQDILAIAKTYEDHANDAFAPSGTGGAFRGAVKGFLNPDIGSARDKLKAIAVQVLSPDFKGPMSNSDRSVMEQGFSAESGTPKMVADGLKATAATLKHIEEKDAMKTKLLRSGYDIGDVEAKLFEMDRNFYSDANKDATSTAPKKPSTKKFSSEELGF